MAHRARPRRRPLRRPQPQVVVRRGSTPSHPRTHTRVLLAQVAADAATVDNVIHPHRAPTPHQLPSRGLALVAVVEDEEHPLASTVPVGRIVHTHMSPGCSSYPQLRTAAPRRAATPPTMRTRCPRTACTRPRRRRPGGLITQGLECPGPGPVDVVTDAERVASLLSRLRPLAKPRALPVDKAVPSVAAGAVLLVVALPGCGPVHQRHRPRTRRHDVRAQHGQG